MSKPSPNMSAVSHAKIVKLEELVEDPHNARQVFDEQKLEALAASIRAQGILQDPMVRALPGGGYRIVDGHRRFRAAKLAGLTEIRVIVQENLDEQQAALAAATANLQREDLTPYEQARAFKTAIELGMEKKELCERAGIVFNTLKARLQLLDLPEGVAHRIGQKGLTLGHAQILAKLASSPKALKFAIEWLEATWDRDPEDYPTVPEFAQDIWNDLHYNKLGVTANRLPDGISHHGLYREAHDTLDPVEFGPGKIFLNVDAVSALTARIKEFDAEKAKEAKKAAKNGKITPKADAEEAHRRQVAADLKKQRDAHKARMEREKQEREGIQTLVQPALQKAFKEVDDADATWLVFADSLGRYVPNEQCQAAADILGIKDLHALHKLRYAFEKDGKVPKAWRDLKPRQRIDALLALAVPRTAGALSNEGQLVLLTGKTEKAWKEAWVKAGKPGLAQAVAPGKKSAQELLKEAKQAKKAQQSAADKSKVKVTKKTKAAAAAATQQATLAEAEA